MMDSFSRQVHYDPPRRTGLFIFMTMNNEDEELYEPIPIRFGNPCPARTSIEGLLSLRSNNRLLQTCFSYFLLYSFFRVLVLKASL